MADENIKNQLEEMSAMSLMDLAEMDTSEIQAKTSRLQAEGIYVLEVEEAQFKEQPPAEVTDPMNFNLVVRSNILAYLPNPDIAHPQELEGKTFMDRVFLWGKELVESIEYLKGKYKQAEIDYSGARMGGIEGQEPGWVDGLVGQRIVVRVRHGKNERAYTDWLSMKQVEKIDGLDWADVIGRKALEEA